MRTSHSIVLLTGLAIILCVPGFSMGQSHFDPAPPMYSPMNIFIIGANYNGQDMTAGDEIAVFDGDLFVGVSVFTGVVTSSNPLAVNATKDDPTTPEKDGFTDGNTIIFKLWDASAGQEYTVAASEVQFYDPGSGSPIDPVPYSALGTAAVAIEGGVVSYELTMAVTPAGGGTTTPAVGTHTYDEGTVVTVTPSPASGYQFVGWEGDVADPDEPVTTVTMNGNKTVTARFAVIQYKLTMAVNPVGGGTTNPAVAVHYFDAGTVVNIAAIPASGYRFVNWTGDVADPSSPSTTVTMTGNKTVTANFARLRTLTMAVNPVGAGTTTPSVGAHTYDENTVVGITATPAAGYRFSNWTGDVADPNNPTTTVTVDVSKTVTANFVREYTLTVTVNPAAGGTTNPAAGAYTYTVGTVVNLTATPATGYLFVSWTGDVADPNDPTTTVTVDGNKTVTANFSQIQYTLTMAVSPTGGGSTSPAVGPHTYAAGTLVDITATPTAGYRFVNWAGDGVTDPNSASTTVTIDGNKTVTANFVLQRTLTIAVNPAGAGTTNPAVGSHVYDDGAIVDITATAAAEYVFVNWTGDVDDPSNPSTTVWMNGEKTVTANFVLVQYTLTMGVSPMAGGTTDPTIGNHIYDSGTIVELTATPAAGYRFANWTGDVADPNSQSTTVTMLGNKQVTAVFADVVGDRYVINETTPGLKVTGTPFDIEVFAQDGEGNIDVNCNDLIIFSANTSVITLPPGIQRLTNGTATFSVTVHLPVEGLLITVYKYTDPTISGTSAPIDVVQAEIDAPDTLIVRDYKGPQGTGDQGGWVMLVFPFSDNHPGIGTYPLVEYYQIYQVLDGVLYQRDRVEAIDPIVTGQDSVYKLMQTPNNDTTDFYVQAVGWSTGLSGEAAGDNDTGGQVVESSQGATQLVSEIVKGTGGSIDDIPPAPIPDVVITKQPDAKVMLAWSRVTKGIDGSQELFGISYLVYSHAGNAYFDPSDEGVVLETEVEQNSATLPVSDLRRFFVVVAKDDNNISQVSNRVGRFGFTLNKGETPKYNHISVPLISQNLPNAQALAISIGGVAAVYKLDPATNAYTTFWLPDIGYGKNFAISAGGAYLVTLNNTAPASWYSVGGVPEAGSIQFTLAKTGASTYNNITIPLDRTNIRNANQLASDVGGVQALYRIDPNTNAFTDYWLPSIGFGTNFAVSPGEPVLITVNQSAPDVWPSGSVLTNAAPDQPGTLMIEFDE